MALFRGRSNAQQDGVVAAPTANGNGTEEPTRRVDTARYELKTRVHRQLIERLDLAKLTSLPNDVVKQQIRRIVEDMLVADETPLSRQEREDLVREVQDETFGLGPIEPLMQDPTVADILVNGAREVYVERRGKLERTNAIFRDDAHLLQIIDRIVSAVGRRIDESSPMVDARLPDGSRINAIIPPLALDGPVLSIRRFAIDPLKMSDLIAYGPVTPALADVLRGAVQARLNILVSGGTGAGKTTLLNVLSNAIPATERIVTIEDSAELQLQQDHVVRLETRPPNIEGKGAVAQRDLVRTALRMRPDRIVVGEVRGGEVLDMLQAMNTGHDGSLSTVHANSSRDALSRLETMILMSGLALPVRAMRDYIASALDAIVHVARLSDGTRKVVRVTEIVGMEEDVITSQDIFIFEQEGLDKDGRVRGYHRATGVRPKSSERLLRPGIELPAGRFKPGKRQGRIVRRDRVGVPSRHLLPAQAAAAPAALPGALRRRGGHDLALHASRERADERHPARGPGDGGPDRPGVPPGSGGDPARSRSDRGTRRTEDPGAQRGRRVLLHRRQHPARGGWQPRGDPGPSQRRDPQAVRAAEPCSRPVVAAALCGDLRRLQPGRLLDPLLLHLPRLLRPAHRVTERSDAGRRGAPDADHRLRRDLADGTDQGVRDEP